MNKTININLASTFFHIDEDAYAVLKSYLNQLQTAFKSTQGKEEILKDIEARIAELFQTYRKHRDYVINKTDVENAIAILGQPEDFITENEPDQAPPKTKEKKLFRDPDDLFVGGVASGLAHYFGMDVVWMRLIWLFSAFFSGGTFVFLYLLLWIIIPKAKTTADKLKMKGEPINVANIEKKIKAEFESVSDRFKEMDYESVQSSLKKKSKNFFNFLESSLRLMIKAIGKLIGLILILVSFFSTLGLMIAFTLITIFKYSEWPFFLWDDFLMTHSIPHWAIHLTLLLFLVIPLLFIFQAGIKLVNPQAGISKMMLSLILLGIWFVALFVLAVLFFNSIFSGTIVDFEFT